MSCSYSNFLAYLAWVIFGVEVISNLLFLYFVLRKLAKGKRNDKVLLLNIIISNYLSLFGSLPGEVLARGHVVRLFQNYCIFFTIVNFVALFTNIISMSVVCYDRYESVVKFPGQRRLSFRKTMLVIALGWFLSSTLVSAVMCGFFVAESQGYYICQTHNKKARSSSAVISFFATIVLVTVCITISCQVIRRSLSAIHTKLKKHRLEAERVLGMAKTVKEISSKKQAFAMVLTYSLCWIPFGVAAILTAFDVIEFYSCIYFGCEIGTYASTAATALVYFAMDKRFRFNFSTNERHVKYSRPSRISP